MWKSTLSLLLASSIARFAQHVNAQLPVGTSTVNGRAEYMATPVATAPLGMPTLAWNCAKMPAICENVNSRNPLTSQGLGYGGLQSGPIELHYDINTGNQRNKLRGQIACPKLWNYRNCQPDGTFAGSKIVCADGDTLAGNCFPGDLWQRTDGSQQCITTPFIAYPGGDAPTALIWSCDEWPPKSTVEGGAGANSACAPLGSSVIAAALLPAAVLAAENKIYSRSEQNYQGQAQNALRAVVSGQNPPIEGIWAFEFNTFYDDDAGSYATRVTYGSQTNGNNKRSNDLQYISELHFANGSSHVVHHRRDDFDTHGRLGRGEHRFYNHYNVNNHNLIPRQANLTSNSTFPSSSTFTTGSSSAPAISKSAAIRHNAPPLGTGNRISSSSTSHASANMPSAAMNATRGIKAPSDTQSMQLMPSANSTLLHGTGSFPSRTRAVNSTLAGLTTSTTSTMTAALLITTAPTGVSTTLVDASTVTANTTVATTGPDGSPTVVPEIIDCDVCGAAALIIFGIPPGIPAVFSVPGVGLVPVGEDGLPLEASAAAAATSSATATTSAADPTTTSEGADACENFMFDNLDGDGIVEDEGDVAAPSSTAITSTSSQEPPSTTSSNAAAESTAVCAASRPQVDCTTAADCTCPDIPGCTLIASCEPFDTDQPQCACNFPQ